MTSSFLKIGSKTTCVPIVHGSGDFAIEVRRIMLGERFDCLAVPLPRSFQRDVEHAIEFLPGISAVVQPETRVFTYRDWNPDQETTEEKPDSYKCSYVPIDPCQGVIAALRIALQERIPRYFIDLETSRFESQSFGFPDAYAVKTIAADRFAAAVLPTIRRPQQGQPVNRVVCLANRLRELETKYENILFICSIAEWPWIRESYNEGTIQKIEDEEVEETQIYSLDNDSLLFLLGELPFITGLYERSRMVLDDDENLSVEGIKELLLSAREKYCKELGSRSRQITPKLLSTYLKYVRNLSLIERRLTPDLYTLVVAAQQILGDQYAVCLVETVKSYLESSEQPFPVLTMGIGKAELPDGEVVGMVNRLPGQSVSWRTCSLHPLPPPREKQEWQMQWDPFHQCSWPPEDNTIERFRSHVKDAALALLGADWAKTEKFQASLKDGLDIRETLRNWHTGDLFVKEFPPVRGRLDCVIMLFDSPADPRDYPWRITWHAEHHDESTLALFATDFHENLVGPGIALATYGGAMFLFPPRPIPDIWQDRRFDFVDTLEERLLAAACYYSNEKHIAILSHGPPGPAWRRLAKRNGKKLIHVPLGKFGQEKIQQLKMFHVLNGQQVRSFAAHFIRKA